MSSQKPFLSDYTTGQVLAIEVCMVVSSSISVAVGILGIFMWIRMAPSRRILFRLRIFIALMSCDFIRAYLTLILSARRISILSQIRSNAVRSPTLCNVFGYLFSTINIYSDLFILVLTAQNALMIFRPQLVKRYSVRVPTFKAFFSNLAQIIMLKRKIWPHPRHDDNAEYEIVYEGGLYPFRKWILCAIIPYGAMMPALGFINGKNYSDSYLCGAQISPIWTKIVTVYALKYFNFLFIITTYTSIMIYLRFNIYKIHKDKRRMTQAELNKTTHDNNDSNIMSNSNAHITVVLQKDLLGLRAYDDERRKQLMLRELKTFALYPLGYIVIWTVPIITQVYDYAIGGPSVKKPLGLVIAMVMLVPLSIVVDTTIFLVREKPWRVTGRALRKQRAGNIPGELGDKLTGELSGFVDLDNKVYVDIMDSDYNSSGLQAKPQPMEEQKLREHSAASSNMGNTLVNVSRQSTFNDIGRSQTGTTAGGIPLLPISDFNDDESVDVMDFLSTKPRSP